jgi:hypothetical protein
MAASVVVLMVVVGGILYAAQNCGHPDDAAPVSTVSSDGSGAPADDSVFIVCKCSDMACWREQTTKRSYDNFKCAKDSLGAAFPLVDIVGSIGFAAYDIAQATSELKAFIGIFQEAGAALKAVKELGPDCVSAVTATTNNFNGIMTKGAAIADKAESLKKKLAEATIVVSEVTDVATAAADAVITFGKLFQDITKLEQCVAQAGGAVQDPTKIKSTLTRAKELLTKAEKPWKELKLASKADVVGKIAKCGVSIFKGAYAIGNNSYCLYKDLQAVYESNKAVAKALAYVGSRQFNHAKYTGCTECVQDTSSTFSNNGKADYDNCRSCCDAKAAAVVPDGFPTKRASWLNSCQLACGIVRTESSVGRDPYTNAELCADVRNVFHVSRFYRHINITDTNLPAPQRLALAEEMRGTVQKNLLTVRNNFAAFDNAAGGSPDGLIGLIDFQTLARSTTAPADQVEAAKFFGEFAADGSGVPYYFGLLDGASVDGATDGVVGHEDAQYFFDEISEYRDETEFGQVEQPQQPEPAGTGAGDFSGEGAGGGAADGGDF